MLSQCVWAARQASSPRQDSLEGSRLGTIDALATAGREKQTVMTPLPLLPALGRTTPPSPCAQPGAGLMPPACWAVSLKE